MYYLNNLLVLFTYGIYIIKQYRGPEVNVAFLVWFLIALCSKQCNIKSVVYKR